MTTPNEVAGQCAKITNTYGVLGLLKGQGGRCSRKGTYTNGRFFLCTQHAKTEATVQAKASNKIQEGFYPIGAAPTKILSPTEATEPLVELLREYQKFAAEAAGKCLALAMSSGHPDPDTVLMSIFGASQDLAAKSSAALSASISTTAPEGDDEGPCTDCYDTGITIQTERRCACQPSITNTAVDLAVSTDDAIKFLESACRNWQNLKIDRDDIADVAGALASFLKARLGGATHG